jgi:hypothetical protein
MATDQPAQALAQNSTDVGELVPLSQATVPVRVRN